MEGKTILVAVLLATLGIAVAVAGFAAEAKRVKTYQLQMHINYGLRPFCDYPSSPTMGLAIAATMALVLARTIIAATTGGCCSRCRRTHNEHVCAQFFIVTSWITSSLAVILFIAGVKLSSQNTAEGDINSGYYCYILRPGVFSAAGIMGLVSVLLGLVYYFIYVSARCHATEKSGVDLDVKKPTISDGMKKSGVDLELEKPPVTNVKKPTINELTCFSQKH